MRRPLWLFAVLCGVLCAGCELFSTSPTPDAGPTITLQCTVATGQDALRGSCGVGNYFCDNFMCCAADRPIRGFDQLCYRTVADAQASGAAGCIQCVPGVQATGGGAATGGGGGSATGGGGGASNGGGAATGGGGGSLDCSPYDLASCVICTSLFPQHVCGPTSVDTLTDCTNHCAVPARVRVCNQHSNLTCDCSEGVLAPGASFGQSTQTNTHFTCDATNQFRGQAAMTTAPVACLNLTLCAF